MNSISLKKPSENFNIVEKNTMAKPIKETPILREKRSRTFLSQGSEE